MPTDYYRVGLGTAFISMMMRLSLPIMSIVVLYVCSYFYGIFVNDSLTTAYLALALVGFLLAFIFTERDSANESQLVSTGWSVAERYSIAWAIVIAALLLLGYIGGVSDIYSRRTLVTWFILTPPCAIAMHVALRSVLRSIVVATGAARSVVVAGVNNVSRKLATNISQRPELGMRLVGCFDDRSPDRLGQLGPCDNLLGQLGDLPQYVRNSNIDTIFISIPVGHDHRVHDLLDELQDTTASVYFVPDIFVVDLIQSRAAEIGGVPIVALCESPFYGMRAVLKRLSDIALASTMLVLAAPVMLTIAAVLRLSSSQSVLFTQRRYGLGGEEIVIYKFRTMTASDDGDQIDQVRPNDERVTRVGRFLRRFSLDELPQLFNVLQGRMSVIGPRPHAVAHNEEYRRVIKGYMMRYKVTPGMTGWAQVNGYRGETSSIDDMVKRVHYDLEYLREWSFGLDLKILWRTAAIVWKDARAY